MKLAIVVGAATPPGRLNNAAEHFATSFGDSPGVSTEIIEAARLDGASERQLFFRVIVPSIRGSIITVTTTIAIITLKIFDIVYVTTGGRFHDAVVAVRMFHELFQYFSEGRAAARASRNSSGSTTCSRLRCRPSRPPGFPRATRAISPPAAP